MSQEQKKTADGSA